MHKSIQNYLDEQARRDTLRQAIEDEALMREEQERIEDERRHEESLRWPR